MPAGRPTKYTKELAERICERIATSSDGMHLICKELKVSISQVYKWLRDSDKQEFTEMYAHAKESQAEYMAQQILDIADDGRNDFMTVRIGNKEYEQENKEVTNRSRLRVDSRKWLMSKLHPRKYGDKITLDQNHNVKELPDWLK